MVSEIVGKEPAGSHGSWSFETFWSQELPFRTIFLITTTLAHQGSLQDYSDFVKDYSVFVMS